MERLGIFVFYDKAGVLDSYAAYLLSAFSPLCQEIIIAVNGKIGQESLKRLESYSGHVLIRTNSGFDAGAYKDIFQAYGTWIQEKDFDEVILLNDTFYGPLYPLQEVLERFDEKTADFWGITRHPQGVWPDGKKFPEHIQSYFLAVKKRMLYSKVFWKFWKDMRYPADIREAIDEFEIKFTTCFTENGFIGKTLTDVEVADMPPEKGKSPYLYHSSRLIKEMRVPFLKRNSLSLANEGYVDALTALRYVEQNLDYNVGMIWENIFRLSQDGRFSQKINYLELEKFYGCHDRVFIYGQGRYGRNIAEYFQYRGWVNSGFLVSASQSGGRNGVSVFSEIRLNKEDGIIVAMGQKNFSEVYSEIMEKTHPSQVMLMQYSS